MRTIIHPTVVFGFFVFGALLCSPLPVSAAVGDNCQTNLVSGIPDSQDWKEVYIVRGDDGSAWQRGIISSPTDALLIKELQTTDITATVGANSETAFFIYADNEDGTGILKKPGEGVCFEGPQGDFSGGVSFPVNARTVWGSLGKKLVVDVFYRMQQNWDQLHGQKTNNNFLIGTFMLPKIVTVQLDIPPASEQALKQSAQGAWEAEKAKAPQTVESANAAAPGSCDERQSVGFTCQANSRTTDSFSPVSMYYRLDPANIAPSLLGNNFDSVGGNSVDIGRVDELTHTHYIRLTPNTRNANVSTEALQLVAHKSHVLEGLKRQLEGALDTLPTLGKDTTPYKIGSLTPDNLTKNAESNEMVKAIKTLLTGSGDRNAAATLLSQLVKGGIPAGSQTYMLYDITPEYFMGLLPTNNCDWTEAFLNILLFWTGSTTANHCVLTQSPPFYNNFVTFPTTATGTGNTGWVYSSGGSPFILLNTFAPVTLAPAFEGTKIVYAEKQFTDGKGWALPAGKKQPLYYRYDFTEPFSKSRAGEMCVKQANLADLVASVGKAYQLTADEAATLSRELTAEFPSTSDFVKVALANPADIAARFSWQGDGKPLSLLQLFFDFTPGGCTAESLVPPALDIPAARDGFEVGILE